ncbi:MAG: manganese catalase family protein [Erysipelotrichales bacterium]|nr:manganese catalase family protein [Erysipelotrichales bacterium]
MFEHKKKMLREVKVERPNPTYANLMQEALGGANGEMTAAMTYLSQSFRIQNKELKDLFLDIGSEELGHVEMVAETINLLNGDTLDYNEIEAGSIQQMTAFGLNPALVNASGVPWCGSHAVVTGDLVADLLTDIAAEQRAKVMYEYLYRQIEDKYVRETIMFLLEREEAHNALFCEALNKLADSEGSNARFGLSEDSKLYFDLSKPGRYFDNPEPEAVKINKKKK